MAKINIVAQLTTQAGCHGIEGGSVDNLDIYTDLVVEQCITLAKNQFKKDKDKNKIQNAIYAYFGRRNQRT